MNKAIVLGRLTSDPEKRVTTTGKPVTSFTLAIDRPFRDAAGNKETDFLPCVIWGKAAEMVADSCKKGQRLLVEGRIQVRNYENREGQKRYVTEIVASSFEFVEHRELSETTVYANSPAPVNVNKSAPDTGTAKPAAMDKLGSAVPFDEEVPF